ncbi:MAG TPA: outer membrane beta-barrel protein [Hyphomicrobiales bacterium]|nr:outer membrane beta-barrel protein [Hyphomicrobiales bacterium]
MVAVRAILAGLAAAALGAALPAHAQVSLRGTLAPSPAATDSAAPAGTPAPGARAPDARGLPVPKDPFADPFTVEELESPTGAALPAAAPGTAGAPAAAGASAEAAPPAPPKKKRKPPEEDPWQAPGIAAGAFVLRPSVDVVGGYDSNPRGVQGGKGSSYVRTSAELQVQSDWSRNSFTADLRGSYTDYFKAHDLDAPEASGNTLLRLDVTPEVTATIALRGAITEQNPFTPGLPANLKGRPLVYSAGTTVGATWKPNRLSLSLDGLVDRYLYQDLKLTNGTTVSAADQDFTAYELKLRAGYDVTPDLTPFVQASINRHQYDLTLDASGFRRSSSGVAGVVGARFAPPGPITAEGDVGYQDQRPDDSRLPDLRGPIFDLAVIYKLSPLTTITLRGSSAIDETTLPGSPGALQYTTRLQIDHALRRWLILSGAVGFERIDYTGVKLTQDLWSAELGLEWKLTPELALRLRAAHERLISTTLGQSYNDDIVEAGVRVTR